MSFDKGQYAMLGLPSRQTAQRDLPSHSRLKLRRTKHDNGETAEEKVKRLKQELEERERKREVILDIPANISTTTTTTTTAPISLMQQPTKLEGFDDADEEDDDSSSSEDEVVKVKPNHHPDVALQKELERVRMEKKLKAEQTTASAISVTNNPLLEKATVQKRWDDDVIFRNQAKGEPDKRETRYVNDITRSDTHKDFLKKHIL